MDLSFLSDARHDEKTATALKSFKREDLSFHQRCYDRYTHKKDLERIVKNREKQQEEIEEAEKNERKLLRLGDGSRASVRRKDLSGKSIYYVI